MHLELQVRPTHVLNAAGVTGRPNVDWCESHKVGAIFRFVLPVGCTDKWFLFRCMMIK
jgi:hypothetical protein